MVLSAAATQMTTATTERISLLLLGCAASKLAHIFRRSIAIVIDVSLGSSCKPQHSADRRARAAAARLLSGSAAVFTRDAIIPHRQELWGGR